MKLATTIAASLIFAASALIPHAARAEEGKDYLINPGDLLIVTVWKEEDLTMDALVRPDGKFSFPLAGDIQASGHTVEDVRKELKKHIDTFIPDAVVTVLVKEIRGNTAYVVGKVTKPGPVPIVGTLDVMQALSFAGGTAQFAKLKDIIILRRSGTAQSALKFNYDAVQDGERLEENIVLQPGDVVVVP
ncbi:MAG: polysaccharide biosynthesis/export family protein [Gammaproteobacteria bacterium]|nr:polysaccharide biosynthesis/export family protein [Gammaproteobacteria bacterium]